MPNITAATATPPRTAEAEFLFWWAAAEKATQLGAERMTEAADYFEDAGASREVAYQVPGLSDWDRECLSRSGSRGGPSGVLAPRK